jgi:serine/threonine protein kinase
MDAFCDLELLVKKQFANIYVAKVKATGKRVCVKKSPVNFFNRQALADEVRIMQLLASTTAAAAAAAAAAADTAFVHPGRDYILPMLASDMDDQYVCLVTEYCTQGDWSQWVLRHRFHSAATTSYRCMDTATVHTALTHSIQAMTALHYVHTQLCAHLDISLENFMLADDGVVLLGDFGLSVHHKAHAKLVLCGGGGGGERKTSAAAAATRDTGGLYGTFGYRGRRAYAAPEVYRCRDPRTADAPYDAQAADIWSLGVLLYHVLTGRPPWSKPTTATTRHASTTPAPNYFSRCMLDGAREYKTVLSQCVSCPKTATELANVLADMLVYEPAKRKPLPELANRIGALLVLNKVK